MRSINRILRFFIVSVLVTHVQCSLNKVNMLDAVRAVDIENFVTLYAGKVSEPCLSHANLYFSSLQNGALWAMQMFDSSAKFPENIIMWQTTSLGNFDECLDLGNVQTDNGTFSGKYCLATITSSSSVSNFASNEMKRVKNFIHARSGGGMSKLISNLTLAQCIPSSCSAEDYEILFNNEFPLLLPSLDIALDFSEDMCQTTKNNDLQTEDWVTIGILIFVAVLAVSSTAYDLLKKGNKNETLAAFSWYSNGKKLLATSSSGDTLDAVHGIRFISMTWVVMGHRYNDAIFTPSINVSIFVGIVSSIWRSYLTSSPFSVDTFFFLGGLLVAYVFLKQIHRPKASFNVPMYYLHRYIRLTPAYAMIMLIQGTVLRYVASGPLYHANVDLQASFCQKYWWASLFYFNNYYKVEESCLGQGWYLAVDMQLFILSPLVLYPLWKFPRKWSLSLLGCLIVAGIVTAFTVSYVDENMANILSDNANESLRLQYYVTHTRFTVWVMGVLFGYIIYHTKKQQNFKLSKGMVFLGWIIAAVALLGPLLGIYPFIKYSDINSAIDPNDYPSNLENSIYTALSRPAWALGIGWLTFACVFGYGGPINTFLSWKAFQLLSRLTYCVYLVHMSYQMVSTFSANTAGYVSDLIIAPQYISDVVISLWFAAILSLCMESPILILEKRLFGGGNNRKNKVAPTTPTENDKHEEKLSGSLKEVTVETPNTKVTEQEDHINKTEVP